MFAIFNYNNFIINKKLNNFNKSKYNKNYLVKYLNLLKRFK